MTGPSQGLGTEYGHICEMCTVIFALSFTKKNYNNFSSLPKVVVVFFFVNESKEQNLRGQLLTNKFV